MKIHNTQNIVQVLIASLCGILLIVGCDSCDNGVTDPPVTRPQFTLTINLHNGAAPEMFIGESVQIAGSLVDREDNKLANEKVFFSVDPDSVGNISPNLGAFTDPTDPSGFKERVTFVARKKGIALITARYLIENTVRAIDTLHVQSKMHGNE